MNTQDVYLENYKLIHHVIQKHIGLDKNHLEYDDLYQVGAMAIIKACGNFDENKGKLKPYLFAYIHGEILKYFRDVYNNVYGIKIPRMDQDLYKLYLKILNDESDLNLSENDIEKAKKIKELKESSISFDYIINGSEGGSTPLHDYISSEYDLEESTLDKMTLESIVKELDLILTDLEKDVIILRLEGLTQIEIGDIVGLSQIGVSRILKKIYENKIFLAINNYNKGINLNKKDTNDKIHKYFIKHKNIIWED